MKDNMLVFTCLGLLLLWIQPVTSGNVKANPTKDVPHLDMAENSVDDMYFKCFKKMTDAVEDKIFRKEMKHNYFSRLWNGQKKCAKNNMNKENIEPGLTKNHMQAICLYTAGGKENFYRTFNNAVENGGSTYTTSFRYHSFHFWLTSAIQILSDHQQKCYHTYRRTRKTFEGKVDERMRFGFFASSSLLNDQYDFGAETCFCIHTCYGAYLQNYPKLEDKEQEVLIPPYEIFKITEKNSRECLPECKVRYTLESTGILSNQNCKLVGF